MVGGRRDRKVSKKYPPLKRLINSSPDAFMVTLNRTTKASIILSRKTLQVFPAKPETSEE